MSGSGDDQERAPPSGMFSPEEDETTAIDAASLSAELAPARQGEAAEEASGSAAGAGADSSLTPPEEVTDLSPGEVLASRFRIVRRLGKGGMGEVYEAFDSELGEAVALKILRSNIASDPAILARFRREIQLARKVTHANICRLYDLRYHRPEVHGGASRPITFLTMELLRGETLARRIRRDGRLIPAEALPILRQVAAGLASAHSAGVVHRDLKASNVMLVPSPRGMRAVITDFGLARAAEPGLGGASLTGTELIVGSPSYMAPEQVAGEPIGPAADIYSFGIVLYEMVTGALPYTGESVISIAVKRLQEPPPSPRHRAPELPAHWEAVILRCLSRRPEDRFTDPQAVIQALESGAAAVPAPAVPAAPAPLPARARAFLDGLRRLPLPVRPPVAAALGAAGLLLIVLLLVLVLGRSRDPDAPPPRVGDRPALAVLTFRNLTGAQEASWLAEALAELLSTDLAAGTELRLVPRETVARAQAELALPPASTLAAASLGSLRSLLGTDYVVGGAFLTAGDGAVQVDLNLQEAASGATRAAVTERGQEKELWQLVATLADRVRSELGIASAAGKVARLATPEATRFYGQGIAQLRSFDPLGARDLLAKAVEADPTSPRAHSALAAAFRELGYEADAEEAARRALDLAKGLPWEERQLLLGRAKEAARQWPEAIAAYESLWSIFYDNVDYGLLLASAQIAAGEGARALTTLEELRKLPAPASDDPRLDLVEAEAARSQSQPERQLAAALRAVEKGQRLGARLLVARGRRLAGEVLENRGDFPAAQEAYREATRLHAAAGDRVGEARALHSSAITLAKQGRFAEAEGLLEEVLGTYREVGAAADEARALSNLGSIAQSARGPQEAQRLYEQALARSREIRDRAGEARDLTNLGRLYKALNQLDRAGDRYREALDLWRQIGDRANLATAMNNLANTLREENRLDEARPLFEGAREIFQELGDRASAAGVLSNLAEIDAEEGDLAAAGELHGRALAAYREIGARPQEAAELRFLAQLAGRRGEVEMARDRYREALAIWDGAGALFPATSARLELAEILYQGGRSDEAAAVARQVVEAIPEDSAEAPPARALAAQARTVEALSALATGDLPSSRRALGEARQQARGLPPEVSLWVEIATARLEAASGRAQAARKGLGEILAATEGKESLRDHRLEARFALGEAELAAGLTGPGVGRARLAALETEARKLGYELLARRAAKLLS